MLCFNIYNPTSICLCPCAVMGKMSISPKHCCKIFAETCFLLLSSLYYGNSSLFILFFGPYPQSLVETNPVVFFNWRPNQTEITTLQRQSKISTAPSPCENTSVGRKKNTTKNGIKEKDKRYNVHILLCAKRVTCKEETNKDTGLEQTCG